MSDTFFEKNERWILAGVFAFVAAICFWGLTLNPPSWFDEGIYHQIVTNMAERGIAGLMLSPTAHTDLSVISVGYPVFYPAVAAFKIFGGGIAVLRLVAVAFLFGFLALFYLLAKRLYGTRSALFVLVLLATFSPLYGHGKNFLGEVPGLFYFVGGLYLLTRWESATHRRWTTLFLSGLAFGFAAASKPTYLVILPAVAAGLAWNWRQYLKDRRSHFACAAFVVGGAIALLIWMATQFGGSFSPARILAHYVNPYYVTDVVPVIVQNLKRFVTETTPAHFLVLFAVSVLFLGKKMRVRTHLHSAEVIIAVFAILILAFYVRTAGWYRYFFPAHALLFLSFPEGILAACSAIGGAIRARSGLILHISVFLLVCIHFIPLLNERFFAGLDAPTALETTLADLPPGEPVLFYSLPQIAARFHGPGMYQYIRMSDHLALGEENLQLAQSGFFPRILMEENATYRLPSCYETERIVHGIRILNKNPNVACRPPV